MTIYPTNFDGRPDLALGIRGSICCKHIHVAQKTPWSSWAEHYFSKAEVARLTPAKNQEEYYKILNEVLKARDSVPTTTKTKTKPKKKDTCPVCDNDWNGVVCDNCGWNG